MNEKQNRPKDKKWNYCPNCGQELPNIVNLEFCIKCGINLSHFKKHKRSQINEAKKYPQTIEFLPQQYPQKLSDDEIEYNREFVLWGIGASIFIPFLALILMIFVSAIFIVIYIVINFDLSQISIESISNIADTIYLDNNFIILLSVVELVFIVIPVIYVRKYLQKPSIKNSLALMGFTSEGFGNKDIAKEMGIGLFFAIVGVIMVISISFLLEFIFPFVEASEIDTLLFSSLNEVQLILYIIIMIFIVGTSEEILFRGFMQKGLIRSKLGVKGGIIISAFIFSMIHVIVFLYDFDYFFISFIPYFLISLLLGCLFYWRKENLIAVMITHGVYDALTLIIFFFI